MFTLGAAPTSAEWAKDRVVLGARDTPCVDASLAEVDGPARCVLWKRTRLDVLALQETDVRPTPGVIR